MAARWQGYVTDPQGNVVFDAEITVRQETAGAPLAVLKADKDGLVNKGNPFVIQPGDNGLAFFYVAGGFYRIEARKGGSLIAEPFRDVAIGTGAGYDIESLIPAVFRLPRVIAAAGSFVVAATDGLIAINLAAPGTVNLALGAVAARAGLSLAIIDWGGNATVILTPAGIETVMGKTAPDRTWSMVSSGGAGMGSKIELIPSVALSGWLVAIG
jgi:hypothetical protein